MDGHLFDKGDFRRRPTDTSQTGNGFPVGAGFIALGLEGVRTVAEGLGSLLVGDDRTVHGTDSQRAVRVRIQVDQHALRAVTHAHQ